MSEKPKAFVSDKYGALDNIKEMIDADNELFDKCIDTINFAFHFNQVCNKAIHYHCQKEEITRLKKALEVAVIGIETAIKLNDQGKIHTAEGTLLEAQKQIKEIMEGK